MKFKEYLNEGFVDDFKYFVSFSDKETNEIVHICGYKIRPDVKNVAHLFEELKTDIEFGRPEDYVDSLNVRIFKKKDD